MIGGWLQDAGAVMTAGPALGLCTLAGVAVVAGGGFAAGFRVGRRERGRTRVLSAAEDAAAGLVRVPGQREPKP